MGKIICDICGTSYPDTAEQCPICGCTREAAAQMLGEDLLLEDSPEEEKGKAGRFSSKRKKEIFDFDEVNSQPKEPEEDEGSFAEGDDEEEEEEGGDRPNTFVVILLTVLIAALLIAAGFLFVKFILPNMGDKDATEPPAQPNAAQTQPAGQTGSIPCETLVLSSGSKAVLTQEGGLFLLHVNTIPSDTTDVITFTSADESIATVSQDGRVEAVSEGETTVTISCGTKTIECQIIVKYGQETVPPTVGEAAPPTEATVPAETTPVTTAPPDVKLKLKRTDISLGVGYEFQLMLDCDLEQNQVQWSSEHPHIVSVDENGVVKALKWGTTSVTAKYGDQEVSCIVRCG